MGGYKSAILSPAQADHWVETLSKHGIEVIAHYSPVDITGQLWLLTIKYDSKETPALKYLKTKTGERGIIFGSVDPDDLECIDRMISLLTDSHCETEQNEDGTR